MANHKSAAKRARQNKKKYEVNGRIRSSVATFEKKIRKAIGQKDIGQAEEMFKTYASKMDRAAKSGTVHANKAARKISRLAKAIQEKRAS